MALVICRICGSNENLKHVFREGNDELLDQIRLCANIQIDALDCMPKYVCFDCEEGLAFSYRLRKRGEETEKKLRQELLIETKNEQYCDGEESLEDVNETLIEESCEDQLWMKDDDCVHFNEHEDFIEKVEYVDEDMLQVLPAEEYDENQQWISSLSENGDIVEEEGIEKVDDFIELIYENTETSSELKQPEIQIKAEVSTLMQYTADSFHNHTRDMAAITTITINAVSSLDKEIDQSVKHCELCPKTFKTVSQLNVHKKSHSKEKLYTCEICGKKMRYQGNLRVHMRTIHSKMTAADLEKSAQPLYHTQCLESMSENCKSITTVFLHEKCKLFKCRVCGKISNFKATHVAHCRIHLNEKPFHCQLCEKSFRQLATLKEHEVIHSGTRPFKCSQCSSSFLQKSALAKHEFWHTGQKPFECSLCGTSFRNRVALKIHERIHTGEKPYSCEICSSKFREKRQLIRHKHLCHHSQTEKIINHKSAYYHCTWINCKKKFVLRLNLVAHLRGHLNPVDAADVLKCGDCQKEFLKPIYMWQHQKMYKGTCAWRTKLKEHTVVKRIPIKYALCSTCCKLFVSHVALARHRRCHLSLREHKCSKCHIRFRHRYSLDLHMRKHVVSEVEIVPFYDRYEYVLEST